MYLRAADSLYELDAEAFAFLSACAEGRCPEGGEPEFIQFCLDEGILVRAEAPALPRVFGAAPAPVPSLRYLLLHITRRCNLRCRHCFQGEAADEDMPLGDMLEAIRAFDAMHGLRLLISGGEPVLHPEFPALNERLPEFGVRCVLLSNGTRITPRLAASLRVHEVQISLDGLEEGHDDLRGRGAFRQALAGAAAVREAGLDLSIATMVHRANLKEFEGLQGLVESLGAVEWAVDAPSPAGNFADDKGFAPLAHEAAPLLEYAVGGGLYASTGDYACGAHLAAVSAGGYVSKCGLLSQPVGHISIGLDACWARVPRVKLDELFCRDCRARAECRGGCRFRAQCAGDPAGPDPVMCRVHGVVR